MTTRTDTTARPALKTLLRWLPTFVGFPLGGLVAELTIDHVDSFGAAVTGGAITGAILGTVQWLGLRRYRLSPELWVGASAVGLAAGLAAGAATVGYRTDLASLALQGVVSGAALGLAQAPLLYSRIGRLALAWPAGLAGLWALGWTITSTAGVDVEKQYTAFGSLGAIAVTIATAVLPLVLTRRGKPVAEQPATA